MSLFLKFCIFVKRLKNVGVDEHGNRYFEQESKLSDVLGRRYVIYKDKNDPTTVPVRWYQWLHRIGQKQEISSQQDYIKPRQVNLTGTSYAHDPHRSAASYIKYESYESWVP